MTVNGRVLMLRVKKVTTKSNTQRLLPIKWILRDIISNQIKSIYYQNTNTKMFDKVTYSELLISDNWCTPGFSNGNYHTSLSF